MTLQSALALGGGVLLLAFVFFAFRHGTKVPPDDRPDHGPSVGTGSGDGSD